MIQWPALDITVLFDPIRPSPVLCGGNPGVHSTSDRRDHGVCVHRPRGAQDHNVHDDLHTDIQGGQRQEGDPGLYT